MLPTPKACYRKAIDLFMCANDASGVAKAAGNLGTIYLDSGRLDEAEQEFILALDAAREAGEERGDRHADAEPGRARASARADLRSLPQGCASRSRSAWRSTPTPKRSSSRC